MKTRILLLSFFTLVSFTIYSQTSVPDFDFETYLETHKPDGTLVGIGDALSMGDGAINMQVPTAKINTVTNLSLIYLGIEKLDGLEDFAALENLTFYENNSNLTAIDLTANSNLTAIIVKGSASLITFDISGLTNVTKLNFYSSGVTSIDVSTLTSLTELQILDHSLLTSLNMKNGFNTNITVLSFTQMPLLNCVNTDLGIPAFGLSNWNNGQQVVFDENCSQALTYVPDDNFESFLETNNMGNGIPNDDKVFTNNINTVTNLNVSSQTISDITGIEDFLDLIELNASSNTISSSLSIDLAFVHFCINC